MVTPPPISNSTVLAPTPRPSLIPDTEPVSLTSAVDASDSLDLISPAVPDVSKRTVLSTVAGINDSSALPDAVIVSPTPKTVLCGA